MSKPTYEELLKKIKDQKLEIKSILSKEQLIPYFDFFIKESPDLICIAGTDAYFKQINAAFTKVLGYSTKELLSQPFTKFIHPEDLDSTYLAVEKLSLGNPVIDFENRYLKKNGEWVYLQWRANLNSSNNLIYAIARDITIKKKISEKLIVSEKLLNEALKIAKLGCWEFNLITNELIWTEELYEIFEIENKPNQKLYLDYLSRFSNSDITKLQDKINKTIHDKKPYKMEHRLLLPNNQIKWVYSTGIPVLNNEGIVSGLRGIAQDITQRKNSKKIKPKKPIIK
ncbi:PAS domain-containing protein [Flavobacterium psychrotolerans]|uniref:histidine kinase n=1 Tax=Flavobacterium psychrotolerans TaxID=2169410 RepID=A0A2U1JGT0_9FLAO|nr:PAS domain-containing protein [Flavobacterium psychrotolerans]PWA04360.1 hypothetical protein DB895_11440 [Flavobacterium psychrotolerans]